MTNSSPIGFLQVQQIELAATQQLGHVYDLIFSVASWESRCTSSAEMLASAGGDIHILCFQSQSSAVMQKKSDAITHIKKTIGSRLRVVDLNSSLDFDANIREIQKLIAEAQTKKGYPLRVLIDMSCLPKRYLLFLLGLGFRGGRFSALHLIYAEGIYELSNEASFNKTTRRGLISEGDWSSVQVPYLESREYAPSKRDLCIGVGAEISVAVPLIERIDPDRMRLVRITDSQLRVPEEVLSRESCKPPAGAAFSGCRACVLLCG